MKLSHAARIVLSFVTLHATLGYAASGEPVAVCQDAPFRGNSQPAIILEIYQEAGSFSSTMKFVESGDTIEFPDVRVGQIFGAVGNGKLVDLEGSFGQLAFEITVWQQKWRVPPGARGTLRWQQGGKMLETAAFCLPGDPESYQWN